MPLPVGAAKAKGHPQQAVEESYRKETTKAPPCPAIGAEPAKADPHHLPPHLPRNTAANPRLICQDHHDPGRTRMTPAKMASRATIPKCAGTSEHRHSHRQPAHTRTHRTDLGGGMQDPPTKGPDACCQPPLRGALDIRIEPHWEREEGETPRRCYACPPSELRRRAPILAAEPRRPEGRARKQSDAEG